VGRLKATLGGAPTDQTTPDDIPPQFRNVQLAITTPADGSTITQGILTITGRATFNKDGLYRLEVAGPNLPGGTLVLAQSDKGVQDGTLGVWDASLAPPGNYTIRLIVVDRVAGESSTQISITVVPAPNQPPGPTPTPGPGPPGQGPQGQGPPGQSP
jgi:hypothetical protein